MTNVNSQGPWISDVVDKLFARWDRAGSKDVLEIGLDARMRTQLHLMTVLPGGIAPYTEYDATGFLQQVDDEGNQDGSVSRTELWSFLRTFDTDMMWTVEEGDAPRRYAPQPQTEMRFDSQQLDRANAFIEKLTTTRMGSAVVPDMFQGLGGVVGGGIGMAAAWHLGVQAAIDKDDTPLPPARPFEFEDESS